MKYREIVNQENPVVYKIIKNSFLKDKVSHAYLFSAPKGIDINNEVMFLVQSLISKEPFDSDELRDVKSYVDFNMIDGSKSLIKKEYVIDAIEKLNIKAFEKDAPKILYISNIENTNVQSLNSLLKFLEEPTDNTYLILSTNHLPSIISTIKSRSQIINIRNKPKEETIKEFISSGISKLDAQLLAELTSSLEKAKAYDIEEINKIKNHVIDVMSSAINNPQSIYLELENKISKKNYKLYFMILNAFLNDIWKQEINIETIFQEKETLEKYRNIKFDYARSLFLIGEFLQLQSNNVNFDLFKNKTLIEMVGLYE